ncbi:MAG: glycoside hydrolase family 127 protein [Planctomycetota bacterium]|jgi:DUF1680 family protein|nr:glycoside hydrolase family 127 protein [Planctomycetota bacterium]
MARSTHIPFTQVTITGGLWQQLMTTNRQVTMPIQHQRCRETGQLTAWRGTGDSHIFWDSDVAKWIEAAAYCIASHSDPKLEAQVDQVITDMAACQDDDGYLNSHFARRPRSERWSNLRDGHELYCAGHLMEAAVAWYHATGKREMLDILCRYADHIDHTFGPKRTQCHGYPGHQEIEIGLVRLYEATGTERYLRLAQYFVDERGRDRRGHYFDHEARARGENPADYHHKTYEYNQSHLPVREQTDVVGHAVRALYLYAGMADVAAHTGDASLLTACKKLWGNLTERRLAIIGGVGSRALNEGMAGDYDLPDAGGYNETCAAVALVFWAHRMFLATDDAQYLDVLEQSLFNNCISGVDHSGEQFFYGNPLAAEPGFDGNDVYNSPGHNYRRVPWFGCSCCPPNIARLIAQMPGYCYAQRGRTVSTCVYADCDAQLTIGGKAVALTQRTDYPWDGRVDLRVTDNQAGTWTLALRIPAWCQGATITVNGTAASAAITRGFARIKRDWQVGDRVVLKLPMPVRQVHAHPRARQIAGQLALCRGPVVYCCEETDNGRDLSNIRISATTRFRCKPGPSELGAIPSLHATVQAEDLSTWRGSLYRDTPVPLRKRPIVAIPYFRWGNRAPGAMRVFLQRG